VEGIGVADIAQFFLAQPDNPDVPIAIDRSTGARTIEIAAFEILTSSGTGRRPIDSFDRGFLEWVTTGGVKMQLAPRGNPLRAPAIAGCHRFSATAASDWWYAGSRRSILRRRRASHWIVASENETTLVISLEMKTGKRFTQSVYPPGKREAFHVNLKLADFEGDGHFDPAQWKSIAIADTLGQPNTIWVAKVAVE